MKAIKKKEEFEFMGYTNAPKDIDDAMDSAVRVKDFLPAPDKLILNVVSKKEHKQTINAWKRYIIKDHERGHRTPLSKTLKEPTARLDTSLILPRSVYDWIKTKPNKAAFIRELMVKSYQRTAH